jgi:hypothetical protein
VAPASRTPVLFERNIQWPVVIHHPAFEPLDCSPGFVTFHFHKAETPAFPGKNIGHDMDGTHGSVFREHFPYLFFRGIRGEISDKHFFQITVPVAVFI